MKPPTLVGWSCRCFYAKERLRDQLDRIRRRHDFWGLRVESRGRLLVWFGASQDRLHLSSGQKHEIGMPVAGSWFAVYLKLASNMVALGELMQIFVDLSCQAHGAELRQHSPLRRACLGVGRGPPCQLPGAKGLTSAEFQASEVVGSCLDRWRKVFALHVLQDSFTSRALKAIVRP